MSNWQTDVKTTTDHHLVGKKVKILPSNEVVDGLHNKNGVIESVKTFYSGDTKQKVLYIIRFDEPYALTPYWSMRYLQDPGTHFRFLSDADNKKYFGLFYFL